MTPAEHIVTDDRGLVDTVPAEVYLAYEDRAKEIAARALTETPTAIKNAILRFALEARLSAALDYGVRPKLTAYELQVLIGTTISGCNMSPDLTFDLPAAWARLRELDLIDRADGIAHATDAGVKLVASILTELQHRRAEEAGTPDGWVLVPRKSTDQMYVAFREALDDSGHIYRFVEAYEAMLSASPSSPASGVRVTVKPLKWTAVSSGIEDANGIGILYRVKSVGHEWWLFLGSGYRFPHGWPTLSEAKAEAQADYEARILSALREQP